ncbi:MAG: Flp family type IVb pilin [Sphingomonadaceae bacterium]|nr:Flp family type IVb pilin [Sphingomonadaceae bacterium]
MIKLLRSLKKDQSGASAAEYALLVAVIGGFVIAAVTAFGGSMKTAFSNQGTALTTAAPSTYASQ